MKKIQSFILATILGLGVIISGPAQAGPEIKNPSFEEVVNLPFLPATPVDWVSLGVSVVKNYTAPNGTVFAPADGERFVVMDGQGSFLASLSLNFDAPVTVLYDWFSVFNTSNSGVDVNHYETTGWNTAEMTFGPGLSDQIYFGMLGLTNPWTKVLGLDNFRIKEVKVSEPATLALILVALFSFSFFAKRRDENNRLGVNAS